MSTRQPVHPGAEDLPEEYFLDGPVPDGDELLLRTVARVHHEAGRSARLRFTMFGAGVLVACAAVVGAGVALGHHMNADIVVAGQVQGTDRRTGAHMQATMTGTNWTHLTVSMTGLPPSTACRLTVVGRDGSRVPGGSWQTSPDNGPGSPVSASASIPPNQVAEIEVRTGSGSDVIAQVG